MEYTTSSSVVPLATLAEHREQRFERPCNPQTSCKLLLLPSELRLKILRMLHRATETLNSYNVLHIQRQHRHDHVEACKDAERSLFELSGQALACCQQLETEASAILYGENILVIDCAANVYMHSLDTLCLGGLIRFERSMSCLNHENEIRTFASAHNNVEPRKLFLGT